MRVITKPFEWISALFCVPALGLVLFSMSVVRGYPKGIINDDPPFLFPEGFMLTAGAVLEIVGIVYILVTWGRSSRPTKIFGSIVGGLPLFFALLLLVFPLHAYRHGLSRWVALHVKPDAVRAWYPTAVAATEPSGPSPFVPTFHGTPDQQEFNLTGLPPDLSSLMAQHIRQSENHKGIYVEWGQDSMFFGSRRAYITLDPTDDSPPDASGQWLHAGRGVFVTDP